MRIPRILAAVFLSAAALLIPVSANASTPGCDRTPRITVAGLANDATVTVSTATPIITARQLFAPRRAIPPLCLGLQVVGVQWTFTVRQFPQSQGHIVVHSFTGSGSFHFSLGSGPGHYALYGGIGVVLPAHLLSPSIGDTAPVPPLLTTLPNTYGTPSDITYLK